MRSWSLTRRIMVTLGIVTALVLGVLAGAALLFASVRDNQQRVTGNYYQAVTLSDRQFVLLLDMETAVRGYALTGDEATLEPLRAAQSGGGDDTGEQLRELLSDDPEALAALDAAAASASAWWTQWAQPTVERIGDQGVGAVTPEDVEEGKRLFDQLRVDYETYIDTISLSREAAAATLDSRTGQLFGAVIAVAVVAVASVAALWWLLRRWVTRPLGVLASETRVVRSGDLDHEVEVGGPPEVVRLGQDVDEMRRSLVEQIAAARSATVELNQANERLEAQAADLERSNRELEQFAYVASHDLQEPLRKVASFTQMLQRRYEGQLDERADQYIDFAVDGAKRMQQLINDLLQFSRVGRITAPQTDVDLDACLDRALRDLEVRIEETDAVITRDPLPTVQGEAPLLTQVLANLVGNALKFRSEEAPRVHVGARRDGDMWEISVSDNGIGIEPQYADRVFVLFQRLHPKDAYAGTGIGLALSRKIVEYHGGTIALDETHEGPGTVIRMTLPVPVTSPGAPDGRADEVIGKDGQTAEPAAAGAPHGSGGPHVA